MKEWKGTEEEGKGGRDLEGREGKERERGGGEDCSYLASTHMNHKSSDSRHMQSIS